MPSKYAVSVALVGTLVLVSAASAQTIGGDFRDSESWSRFSDGPATVVVNGNNFEVVLPSSSASGGMESVCKLVGDFDVQVDFSLSVWPTPRAPAAIRIGLPDLGFTASTFVALQRNASRQVDLEFYTMLPPLPVADQKVTSDRSGTLRLVRSGSTVTGYAAQGGGWTLIGTRSTSSAPTTVDLLVTGIGTGVPTNVRAGFGSFRVTRGSATCPVRTRRAVFLIHGIRQDASGMGQLADRLRARRKDAALVIDSGFDYSKCANRFAVCSDDCTISNGARELAAYIENRLPPGNWDISFVAYSMGGLIARDFILNNYNNVLRTGRRVAALITLGTPHLGYPHVSDDDLASCSTLAREMRGDFRNNAASSPVCRDAIIGPTACVDLTDRAGHTVAVSPYLAELNTRWDASSLSFGPSRWMAMSGTACVGATRFQVSPFGDPVGCSDQAPFSDGVVCDQSARLSLWSMSNGPTDVSFNGPSYVHTKTYFQSLIFPCTNTDPNVQALNEPGDEVVDRILASIE